MWEARWAQGHLGEPFGESSRCSDSSQGGVSSRSQELDSWSYPEPETSRDPRAGNTAPRASEKREADGQERKLGAGLTACPRPCPSSWGALCRGAVVM